MSEGRSWEDMYDDLDCDGEFQEAGSSLPSQSANMDPKIKKKIEKEENRLVQDLFGLSLGSTTDDKPNSTSNPSKSFKEQHNFTESALQHVPKSAKEMEQLSAAISSLLHESNLPGSVYLNLLSKLASVCSARMTIAEIDTLCSKVKGLASEKKKQARFKAIDSRKPSQSGQGTKINERNYQKEIEIFEGADYSGGEYSYEADDAFF